jgi:hypothetical protein
VNNAKVTMEGSDAAKVQFSQRYVADGKPQSTRKTLAMTKVGLKGGTKIGRKSIN